MGRRFLLSMLVVVSIPAVAYGQSIAAVWDPNPPEDEITGYQVCIGTASLSCNVHHASVPVWETSYTFAPTPGVLYRVAVRAVNASGAGAYTPEHAASIPLLAQPPNQTSSANVPISPLSLSATDPDGSTLRFSHSGLPIGLSLNTSTGVITGTPTATGTFNVTVYVSDDLETSSRTFVWTVQPGGSNDVTAPTLAITSHSSGQTVATSSITLAGTASDSGTGGRGIASVTVNGASASGGSASGSNTANWSRGVTLATGANTLTVVATDGAGNARTSTITINLAGVDTTRPTLNITSHASGQTVGTSTITVVGTASDSGAGGSGIASVTVNGSPASGGSASGNNIANWSRSITLASGANVVTVVATDGAGNSRTLPITLVGPSTNVAAVTVSSSLSSPRTTGTSVTFTATGLGGSGPYSFKWWAQKDGGAWVMLQDWSTSTTWTWTPTQPGNYVIGAWGRGAGSTADVAQAVGTMPFVFSTQAPAPAPTPTPTTPPSSGGSMTAASVTANLSSPRAAGTTVTFTASGVGGTAPYSFKWWVQKDGGAWVMLQDWSTSATWTWTPAQAGNYLIGIWSRSAGNTTDRAQAIGTTPFGITTQAQSPSAPPPPSSGGALTGVSVSANVSSPRSTGTTVTFTATGVGGTAPYAFKWWLQKDGGAWVVLQDWSTSTTSAWTPAAGGTYVIGAWGRSAGSNADTPQAIGTIPYLISGPSSSGSMTGSSLAANVRSIEVGDSLTVTASGVGGAAPYQFKWWVQKDGGEWMMLRDWSTSTTYTGAPALPGNYVIGVWGRSAGSTADAAQTIATTTIAVRN